MKILMFGDSMTPPTRPIMTKNPVANFIIRVLVIIGLLMFFSSESMADKKVTYSPNNATSGTAPAEQTTTNFGTVIISSNSGNLVKTNFVFSGWNTNESGTGTTYQPGTSFTLNNESVTLYAKWVAAAAQTPPTMGDVPNQTATVGTAFTLSISSYVTPTDGDTVTSYTLTGTLPAGLSFNTSTGVISGTPTTASAAVTLSVTATDNDGTSNSDSFTITVNAAAVINHNPVVSPSVMSATFSVTTAVSTTIMDVNATDIDNDTLTYAITNGNASGTFGINSTTGVISLNNALYAGTYTLTVTVTDGNGGSATGTVTVNATSVGGGGTTPNPDQCGMFPSVLTAQNNIEQSAGITCSISDPGNVGNDITVINTTVINASNLPTNLVGCAVTAPPPVITLPTFLHSSNMSSEQSISANTTITAQNANSIRISSNGITVTFTANQPYYSDSSINVMKIGTVDDQNSQDITYVFNEGDYWIENWNTNGNNVVIKINGHVRLFIGNNFTANTNNLQVNVSPNSGVPSNLYVYTYNDVVFSSSGSANYDVKAYFYAGNNFVANGNSENQYFTGAIRAGNNISLGANQHFYYNSTGSNGNADDCILPNYNLTGPFDAWDTFRNTLPSVSDRNISTKVVSQDFNLTIGSLNNAETAVEAKPSGIIAYYRLYDFDTNTPTPLTYALFDANASASITSAPLFNVSSASKNMKVQFKFCADYNGTIFILKPNTECGGIPVCTGLNTVCYRETVSSDAFAIRPNMFSSSLTGSPYKYKAGTSEEIIFQANAFGGAAAQDYNETEDSSFVADVNISDNTKLCAQPSINFSPDINFANGTNVIGGVNPEYSLPNVGDFNVTVHEKNGGYASANCNNNPEYAHVDCDDTIDTLRLITPHTVQIKVIPDHFTLDGNLTNGSNGFTYFSNFEGNATVDQNISALLDANITARTFSGVATSNYTSSCYAKDGNVSLGITLSAITPSGNLSKMLWYDDINNSVQGNFLLAGPYASLAYPALRFVSGDTNGTGNIRYRLNFDRNQTMVVNPFTMVVNEVNATDIDTVDGNQILTTNNSAYYVYGRIIPRDIRVFGANTPFTANAWYEVYNVPAINGTSLSRSKNDSVWFINKLHSDTSANYDGDANVTVVNTASMNVFSVVGADGVENYAFTSGMALGGYKAHINTDPWLWYGSNASGYLDPNNLTNLECLTHPCFNINVVPPIGATGSAKSGGEANKASKSSTGGGGWQSTSDYAPAIR